MLKHKNDDLIPDTNEAIAIFWTEKWESQEAQH
jgi:hypothetical protein